jgi:hypothetical protein
LAFALQLGIFPDFFCNQTSTGSDLVGGV